MAKAKKKRRRRKLYSVVIKRDVTQTAERFVSAFSSREAIAIAESVPDEQNIWRNEITASWPSKAKATTFDPG